MVQEKNNYCLCSVISDILRDYKIKLSQDEIASNLTPSSKGFKADDNIVKEFLKKKGFDYNFYWWNETPLNEPDSLLVEISNQEGFIGIKDHVYRVLEFHDPKITVLNPANDSISEINYNSTIKKLKEEGGCFGLLRYIH